MMVAAAALVVAAIFYFSGSRAEPGSGIPGDTTCKQLVAQPGSREALAWLGESKRGDVRTLGEQDSDQSVKIVREFYSAGAVNVVAVKIDHEAGLGETTNVVCVALPAAGSARQKLFAMEADYASRGGFDGVADDGQTYLFFAQFKLTLWQAVRSIFHR